MKRSTFNVVPSCIGELQINICWPSAPMERTDGQADYIMAPGDYSEAGVIEMHCFQPKIHKHAFGGRLHPDPLGSLSAPSDPSAAISGMDGE